MALVSGTSRPLLSRPAGTARPHLAVSSSSPASSIRFCRGAGGGRINGTFVLNPTVDELGLSDLNLVYECSRDKTLMIDVQACEITERDLQAGMKLAHSEAIKCIDPQIRLAKRAGKEKKEYKISLISDTSYEKIRTFSEAPIEEVFTDSSYGKVIRKKNN
ncbi:unnamed protein product [Miscanthus lutarioriparius]|uniref:Exoribonuclease phosphorolytic domain-containing protein n=1 Tax=Miscanthus lutarioriparius TaxID=422564 RepID=A0A811NEW4_9POAL|nr:unnamed protein product [Miscanthus lutarioriparius]